MNLRKVLHHLRIYESAQILVPGLLGIVVGGSIPPVRLGVAYLVAYFSHVLSIYSYNDYCDFEVDSSNPRKEDGNRRDVRWLGYQTLALGIVFLVSVALLPLAVALLLVANQVFCMAYSAPGLRLKGRLLGSELAHFFAGSTYFMSGVLVGGGSLSRHWMAAILFGLLYLSGGTFNEIMDCEADRASGLRHLVVRIGSRRALRIVIGAHVLALGLVALFEPSTNVLWATCAATLLYLAALAGLSRDPTSTVNLLLFRKRYRRIFAILLIVLGASRVASSPSRAPGGEETRATSATP